MSVRDLTDEELLAASCYRWSGECVNELRRRLAELDRLDAAEKALREIVQYEPNECVPVAYAFADVRKIARDYLASVEGGQDGQ